MIVDGDELLQYMSDIGLTPSQTDAADMVIAGVQAELETYLGRPVELRTVTERIEFDDRGVMYPSVTPVVSTTTLGVRVRRGQLQLTSASALALSDLDVGVDYSPDEVDITYVGGLDGPNLPDLRLAVLRVAAREMELRHDDTLTIKNGTLRNEGEQAQGQPATLGWQERELNALSRYRRKVAL